MAYGGAMALPRKYPKLRRPGHPETDGMFADPDDELVITEKFDGNNFRFCLDVDEGTLRFGSRNCDLGCDVDEIGGMFDDVSDYLADHVGHWRFDAILNDVDGKADESVENLVMFGENAVEHTIDDYVWGDVPQFQLFDVWVVLKDGEGFWLEWDDVIEYSEALSLHTPPLVERTTVGEFSPSDFEIPESRYRPTGKAEGVVIRNVDKRMKAKIISEEFAEKHESAKASTQRSGDLYKFVDTHATPNRIRKNAHKVVDDPTVEYQALQMEIMEYLPKRVWRDLWEEDLEDIIWESYEIDLGECRSEVSSKCARVLREQIRSREIDVAKVDTETGETVE